MLRYIAAEVDDGATGGLVKVAEDCQPILWAELLEIIGGADNIAEEDS
jgi:hypothetical protein